MRSDLFYFTQQPKGTQKKEGEYRCIDNDYLSASLLNERNAITFKMQVH